MTPANLTLVLCSTLVHVLANTAFKRARSPTAFAFGMISTGAVLFAPLLLFARDLSWFSLGILALSGLLDALYFFTMSRAYALTDLSVAYPLARGVSPLLLLIWSVLLLGERPSPAGLLGIGLIVVGLYVVNLKGTGGWRRPLQSLGQPGPRRALLAGLFISLYSALDKYGVIRTGLPPLTYTYLTLVFTVAWLAPIVWRRHGWAGVRAEWQAGRLWMLLGGIATMGAYGLVLTAISRGAPVSYAGAVREFSVVVGAIVGWRFLREQQGPGRVAGASLVACGVTAIALGR